MPVNLVIVESPTKAKTIQKYLGKSFEVISSFGHIVDLPKKNMGIDINNNFRPIYEISPDKKNIVKELNKKVKEADIIWLASDEDREGEAIAWHLFKILKLQKEKTKRITFHEITKKSIQQAIQNPRFINHNLVNAQQTRRILDRIVGFELSPILWKKIKTGLSAGRVQSVALRLISEREKEIINFIQNSIYKIKGIFLLNSNNTKCIGQYSIELKNKNEVLNTLEKFKNKSFKIIKIDKKKSERSPSPPFTTSTLQQESSLKLGMSILKTMKIAQTLYEKGFITYMRTDSVNLSEEALSDAEKIIKNKFGLKYYNFRKYKNKYKHSQEAHEAIRPTKLSVDNILGDIDQIRLYNLIWKRTLGSQMQNAQFEKININIITQEIEEQFIVTEENLIFDGFLKLYINKEKENINNKKNQSIYQYVKIGDNVNNLSIEATEHFLNPLPRYTEASLVKKLEELGIGRPSTYAPIICTIQERKYVIKSNEKEIQIQYKQITLQNNIIHEKILNKISKQNKNKLIANDIGIIVSDFLIKHFKKILEYNFTAKIEKEFDEIASGNKEWTHVLKDFYQDFHKNVEYVNNNTKRINGYKILGIDPKTKKNVYIKIGKYGTFVQIGESNNNNKPKFASLLKNQNILSITLKEALELFNFPKTIGKYENENIEINNGKYGPYIKYKNCFYGLPDNISPIQITLKNAIQIIQEKLEEKKPIHIYNKYPVTKGKGKFGSFIKWNNIFINVPNKYDFNNLSIKEIEILIQKKIEILNNKKNK